MCETNNDYLQCSKGRSGLLSNSVGKFKADSLIAQMQHHAVNATKYHFGSVSPVKERFLLALQHYVFFSFYFKASIRSTLTD